MSNTDMVLRFLGAIGPGDRGAAGPPFTVGTLAQRLGLGHAACREALYLLCQDGRVEIALHPDNRVAVPCMGEDALEQHFHILQV